MNVLRLDAKHIEQIAARNHVDIVRLFKRFVELECLVNNIETIRLYFSEKTTTPDGGEDGFLEINKTRKTRFKKKYNCFQFKSSNFSETECANEIIHKCNLKPKVKEALERGGYYFQVISKEFGARQNCTTREDAIFAKAKDYLPDIERKQIVVLDAEDLATWFSERYELVVIGYKILGVYIPDSIQTIDSLCVDIGTEDSNYYKNGTIDDAINTIKDFVGGKERVLRIIGQSGLGKTRFIAQVFSDEIKTKSGVVYCKVEGDGTELVNFLRQYYLILEKTLFILDDCSADLHEKISVYFNHKKSKISLISIDHEVMEYLDSRTRFQDTYLYLSADGMMEVASAIIGDNCSKLLNSHEIQFLIEYADGNPFLAKMIVAEIPLRKPGDFFGEINQSFKKKLLLGRQRNTNADQLYNVAKTCSLFDYFGFPQLELESILSEDEQELIKTQVKTLARKICTPKLKVDIFEKEVNFLKSRGLIHTTGKYYAIRPVPLAINLAMDYFDSINDSNKINELVEQIEENNLTEAFCRRFKYLGGSAKAKLIADRVCGENSPFAKAEVLNTELGSRLFRSFVEVNPEALMKTLVKLYQNVPISELKKVDVGRRNIVLSLEILCFIKNTFNQAAKILFRFAQAENESWSNNSQGIFKQLFRPYLSGTEVDLEARIEILKYAISEPFIQQNELLIDAMMTAFDIVYAVRLSGPEIQGTRVLEDYKPTNKQEILDYWVEVINIIQKVWEDHPEFWNLIEERFFRKSLQIIAFGKIDLVVNFVDWLESKRRKIPSSFYNSLNQKLNSNRTPENIKKEIRFFLESKKPRTHEEIFIREVKDATYSRGKDRDCNDIDQTEARVRVIANKFYDDGVKIVDLLELMLRGHQRYTEFFVTEYLSNYIQVDRIKNLWDLSVEKLTVIEQRDRNWAVLNGILKCVKEHDKLTLILSVGELDGFEELFISLVNLNLKSLSELEVVWDLVSTKKYDKEIISKLRYGNFVFSDSFEPVRFICDRFKTIGEIGDWSVLDVLYRRNVLSRITNRIEWDYLKETFEKFNYFKFQTKPKYIDLYDLVEVSERLVKQFSDTEFIELVIERLLNFISTSKSISYDDYFSKLVEQLISTNFDTFWSMFSEKLIMFDQFVYRTKNLIGSDYGNTGSSTHGALFSDQNNWDKIITWCKANSAVGPNKIALLMPLWDDDWTNLHPFAKVMIDTFGDRPDFLGTISLSLDSYGWVGSLVEYYESEKRFYEVLSKHSNPNVSSYAKKQIENLKRAIEREKLEDEERYLGL